MLSLGNMIRKSQPALFWCMLGLPKSKREAVFTLFAFCRHLDAVARSAMPDKEKKDLLDDWREELGNIYDKKVPVTNIGRRIYKNCLRFDLPENLWLEILDSAYFRAFPPKGAPDEKEFEQYMRGTSEVPLQIALMITDPDHPKACAELAENLGRAFLITYMLRDIKDDAKSGQLYIPAEILQKAGVRQMSAREVLEDKNLPVVRELLAGQAEKGYAAAERLLAKMNRRETAVLRLLYSIGTCQLEMMKKRGWEIISPKIKVGFFKRLEILYRTLFE